VSELLSAEEFYRRHENDRCELVEGRVVEVAWTTPPQGIACAKLSLYIGSYLDGNPIGHAMSNDTFIITRRDPDCVRRADFCFVTKARMPDDRSSRLPRSSIPRSKGYRVNLDKGARAAPVIVFHR